MEAEDYFSGKSLYLNLFKQAKKSYHQYGRLAGTFKLAGLSNMEKAQLALFLGLPEYELSARQRIKWSQFESAFAVSRFRERPLIEVMAHVLREPFTTRSEDEGRQADDEHHFKMLIREKFPSLQFLIDQDAWKLLYDWYSEDEQEALTGMKAIVAALTCLPEKPVRLPFFAHQVTGNPHTFDTGTRTGKIFIDVLQKKRESERPDENLSRTEFYNDLLLSFNLVRDDIMNFVAVNGLLGWTKGQVHPVWQAAVDTRISWNVPVRHLLEIEEISPARGNDVYLVENSGVYSTFLDARPTLPLVCTNGQFRLAAWMLLDKLAANGSVLHYAGDFDPEGLQMADQILNRFPDQVRLWGMDLAHYLSSMPAVPISGKRLVKLKNIRSDELRELATQMQSIKRAGYQEAISQKLLDEIGLRSK